MARECSINLKIESEIFKLRTRMINVGILKGLTHPETIKYSQELDVIMNHFQKIKPRINEVARK